MEIIIQLMSRLGKALEDHDPVHVLG